MNMTSYINAVKRGLRDQHNIKPTGGTDDEPLFAEIPDGEYRMEIAGRTDRIVIRDGQIHCGNF